MVYEASYVGAEEIASIAIPGIAHIMIIGDSDTAREFTRNIRNIARYQKIYHVAQLTAATDFMADITFSIFVIDADSHVDPISTSRIIRIHNSKSRVVLISRFVDEHQFFDLKNKGIIHSFISIPCDDLYAHTVIVREQALYHINQSLNKLLITSPRHSGPPRHLAGEMETDSNVKMDLVGAAIVEATVTKYDIFFDRSFQFDSILMSNYFSALSHFGNKLIDSTSEYEGFEFKGLSVFLKTHGALQYLFFMRNVNDLNKNQAVSLILELSNKLHIKFGDEIVGKSLLTESLDSEISDFICHYLPPHQRDDYVFQAEEKAKIINYKEPNSTLLELYDETSRVYEVHDIDDENQLLDMIKEDNFDLVVINNFEEGAKKHKGLISIIKDECPFTQCVAIIDDIGKVSIDYVLNLKNLDFVMLSDASMDDHYNLIKKALDRSRSIKQGITLNDLSTILKSYDQSEIIKTMLRKNKKQMGGDSVPLLNGIFIFIENIKYYSNYYTVDKERIVDNEFLFIGFIESLLTFTNELQSSPLTLSGIKYGDSHLIIQNHWEYTFIYFVGNMDNSNYDFIDRVLSKKSSEIYTTIKMDENPYMLSDDYTIMIDQLCTEIRIQFSFLQED